jgi:mono/diheme cytochrome c family protein
VKALNIEQSVPNMQVPLRNTQQIEQTVPGFFSAEMAAIRLAAFSPIFWAAFGFTVALWPVATAQGVSTSAATTQGKAIFHQRCVGCHNQQPGEAAPFGPPNLYTAFKGQQAITSEEAEIIIARGKGQMPAFGNVLSKHAIRSVISYLRARQ